MTADGLVRWTASGLLILLSGASLQGMFDWRRGAREAAPPLAASSEIVSAARPRGHLRLDRPIQNQVHVVVIEGRSPRGSPDAVVALVHLPIEGIHRIEDEDTHEVWVSSFDQPRGDGLYPVSGLHVSTEEPLSIEIELLDPERWTYPVAIGLTQPLLWEKNWWFEKDLYDRFGLIGWGASLLLPLAALASVRHAWRGSMLPRQ